MISDKIPFSCSITMNTFYHLENKWNESYKLRPLILLAAAVSVAVAPILLLADAARWTYRSGIKGIPSSDYHYFYSSEIFSAYQKQIQEYIGNELKKHPELSQLDIVQWINNPGKDKKQFYQGIISRLRDLVIRKKDLNQKTSEFMESLCCWIYTGPKLLPSMIDWVKSHLTENEKQSIATKSPHLVISDIYNRWNAESKFQGEIFQDYRSYDPRFLGDTPSHFFRVHNTDIIRTPAITKDEKRSLFGHLTKASIVEEFQGFLQHYRKSGKEHLYVNLMAPHGSEKLRIEALEDLEKENSDIFHLLTLSKDCAFYHQVGHYYDHNGAETFKNVFIDEMFGSHPGFRWPSSWDRDSMKKLCREAIELIHAKHFASAPSLSREERCCFIELAYTEIIKTLLRSKNPATCNVSCRSCVDRGAANLSLLYASTQLLTERSSHETLATITIAPAAIAQSRVMLPNRMHRLVPALAQITSSQ